MKLHSPYRIFKGSLSLLVLATALACTKTPQTPTDLTKESFIPLPVSVTASGESFTLTDQSGVYHNSFTELLSPGIYLAEHLVSSTGFSFSEVSEIHKTPRKGNIFLVLDSTRADLGMEGYELNIAPKLVLITGLKAAGVFYGIQTLLQMLPVSTTRAMAVPLTLATGIIKDSPEYAYRGAMLDVARHFFKPDDVKRFIDLMAVYKLNYLHLHLADDQGWRIEIKSWPNLAAHGGSTQVGGGAGGFYTQEEYKDIVRYAQTRYITIVPEIDMPGHTNAALASYAELNCSGEATRLYTGTNVGFSTLCTSKVVTYQFISDVFRELAGLTPGPYIHIGGDESHVTKLADYIPFINQVQEIVSSHGKQTMGWDDIAAASLKPGTVAQHWATVPNAVNAAGQGSRLVLSPARKAYLDMKYDSSTKLGLNWAGYIEVDSAYIWDPATYVPGIGKNHILGIEAPLWSETVTTMDEIEFMVFPRLPGYAEIGWTPPALRVWDEYKVRLAEHGARLEAMGIDFYHSPRVPWTN
ncbi:MAG TPA: beta-N-acetylhexosaminidase [Bacteroidales bacterium]|nr:beta-N-acetylhexosaminidase [Bacteroidales bacterium]